LEGGRERRTSGVSEGRRKGAEIPKTELPTHVNSKKRNWSWKGTRNQEPGSELQRGTGIQGQTMRDRDPEQESREGQGPWAWGREKKAEKERGYGTRKGGKAQRPRDRESRERQGTRTRRSVWEGEPGQADIGDFEGADSKRTERYTDTQ
jgi:hypothetical protein